MPIWSPDGASITFASGPQISQFNLFRKASNGAGSAEKLTADPSPQHSMDWSRDGRYLAFTRNEVGFGTGLMILPTATGKPYTFLQTGVSEAHSQFDPATTRWIAYDSDDSGRREIYVQEFVPSQPASSARRQLSSGGGTMPRWRADGKELYYWALDGKIMAVPVDGSGPAFQSSTPVALFQVHTPTLRTNIHEYDVTRDGKRFLLQEPAEQPESQPLVLVTDWLALKR